ncbi:DUF6318 family protein [Paeniglutamicibacter gangotriensis]|uniref:DUF6318 domain-containing protein n=1 Tax=Paeniglutamicibacter gangotriensis Lz1y TaxID=1276920 RepID=M7MQD9_9MICC|nr:DUF6318 family protein [Paeniglutamicibacter gangotriensis]EMQ98607.1 hypothetical protein ADIAG_02035 [Paeniglutamicibacter gangotriensis Lz1y]
MFGKYRTILLVACSGALVVSATGCVGNADPVDPAETSPAPTTSAASSPPTASPSPTAKPTSTPVPASSNGPAKNWPVPKMPESAKEKSEEGISAFAEHYYDLVNYTIQTNDTKPIKKVTNRSCTECGEGFIDPFDNNLKAGSWLAGADFEITVTKSILQPKNGVVLYTSSQGEMVAYMSDGTRQGVFPASTEPFPASMLLSWDDGWHVETLEYLEVK